VFGQFEFGIAANFEIIENFIHFFMDVQVLVTEDRNHIDILQKRRRRRRRR
jgi:hypothetical protein